MHISGENAFYLIWLGVWSVANAEGSFGGLAWGCDHPDYVEYSRTLLLLYKKVEAVTEMLWAVSTQELTWVDVFQTLRQSGLQTKFVSIKYSLNNAYKNRSCTRVTFTLLIIICNAMRVTDDLLTIWNSVYLVEKHNWLECSWTCFRLVFENHKWPTSPLYITTMSCLYKYIFLFNLFKGPGWEYETDLPDWASIDWIDEDCE